MKNHEFSGNYERRPETMQQEIQAWQRGDPDAGQAIVAANERFVESCVRDYASLVDNDVPVLDMSDLQMAGDEALLRAAKAYDIGHHAGANFLSYAVPAIRGALYAEIFDFRGATQPSRRINVLLKRFNEAEQQELNTGVALSNEAMAAYLNDHSNTQVPVVEADGSTFCEDTNKPYTVPAFRVSVAAARAKSLDAYIDEELTAAASLEVAGEDPEQAMTWEGLYPMHLDPAAQSAAIDNVIDRVTIQNALDAVYGPIEPKLEETDRQTELRETANLSRTRNRAVIETLYGIGGDVDMTLTEAAAKFGVVVERIRQIRAKGLAALHDALSDYYETDGPGVAKQPKAPTLPDKLQTKAADTPK
jgi:DNA-directed RNA polymerase specialized sigma subunit